MNLGRRYLLAICCLLISLAPAYAQKTGRMPAQQPRQFGFVPKHEQIQRLRGSQATTPAISNPFAAPVKLPPQIVDPAETANVHYVEPTADTTFTANGTVEQASYHCDDFGGVTSGPGCGAHGCAGSCGNCCQPVFWIGADYLLWSTRQADSPVLASTSVPNTEREAAGVLDELGVSTLFGGDGLNGDMRSGGRFSLGGWFSPDRVSGIELTYITLAEEEESFSADLNDFSILARPFYNIGLIEEDSRLINFPDVVRGDLSIRSTSEFDSFEIMFLRPAPQDCGYTNLLLGYRQVNLDEMVRFDETTTSLVSPTLDSTFELFDEFRVENSFRGGQIGFHHVGQLGNCWSFGLLGKASLGSTRSRIQIAGQSLTTTSTGDESTAPEGLLALASNSGSHSDSEFGSLFEVGINLRRRYQNGLQFKIGYSYLHWSTVARAAEQIDRNINPTEVPPDTVAGSPRPRVPFERSGFWAQGLNLGLEYQF